MWTTFGLQFIDEAQAAGKPFFLYLAHNAPHFPLQARAEEIALFRGRYREGWDVLAQRRLERQQQLELVADGCQPAARPAEVAAWESLTTEEQDRFDHLMAVYAATVHLMDRSVGDLVAGLRDRSLLDNTLILFMSDNGGNAESGPAGRTVGDPTDPASSWFCGQSWAYLQNVPFRKSKRYAHEGGIATPLIAHWPRSCQMMHAVSVPARPAIRRIPRARVPPRAIVRGRGRDVSSPPLPCERRVRVVPAYALRGLRPRRPASPIVSPTDRAVPFRSQAMNMTAAAAPATRAAHARR